MRITPACAGIRYPDWRNADEVWDHPRMRGDKDYALGAPVSEVGSPPHARG